MGNWNLKIEEWITQDKWFFCTIPILGILVYFPIIFSPSLVDIDFGHVFVPIDEIPSIKDYLTHKVHIIDLQPVRDFFIMFMLKVNRYFDNQVYGFFNFVVWLLSVTLLSKILEKVASLATARLIALSVLVHPIAAWTLYWPTAIKHLLSLFFLSLASFFLFEFRKGRRGDWSGFKVFFFYLLSINSQPITLLFPFVIAMFLFGSSNQGRKKDDWILLVLCFLAMIIFGLSNYIYYRDVYPLYVGVSKMDPISVEGMAINFFGLSRSLTQLLIPLQFAMSYSFSSLLNFFGLPLFVFIFVILNAKFDKKTLAFYFFLILFPLCTIYGKKTNIFVSDTYLLVPLFSLSLFLSVTIIEKYKIQKWLIPIILFLAVKSSYESFIVSDEDRIFKVSYERERECKTAFSYSSFLLFNLEIDRFKEVANNAIANRCILLGGGAGVLTSEVYSFLVYFSEETQIEDKIKLISKVKNKTNLVLFILNELKRKGRGLSLDDPEYQKIEVFQVTPSRRKLYRKVEAEL